MARNVCLDCGYFLNCKLASEHLTYCEKFVKAHRTISKIENRKEDDYGKFSKENSKTTIDERTQKSTCKSEIRQNLGAISKKSKEKGGEKVMNDRAKYTNTTEEQQNRIDDVRNMFSDVYDFIETNCKQSRETSLALTKLEEAQFWAIKGITREKPEENKNITGSITDENGNLLF